MFATIYAIKENPYLYFWSFNIVVFGVYTVYTYIHVVYGNNDNPLLAYYMNAMRKDCYYHSI